MNRRWGRARDRKELLLQTCRLPSGAAILHVGICHRRQLLYLLCTVD
jgi:hypothetical protein